jgi:GNAT superfamily N-acetyltransferase
MRRSLADGYELDDDRDRVDVEAVYRFLADEAYWVRGRSRAVIERLVRTSTSVMAAYAPDGSLVGFARVMSDGANMAWLGDVFVLAEHRGRGIGTELVREAVEDPRFRSCAWYLNTRDAHALYRRFGFRPADPALTMVRPRPAVADQAGPEQAPPEQG